MPSTTKSAERKLGPERLARARDLLAAGLTGAEVARVLDVDPRLVSLIKDGPGEQPGTQGDDAPPLSGKSKGKSSARTMKRYNRLLMKKLPLEKRADLLVGLAQSQHPVVKQNALERMDEIGGLIPTKTPPPPPAPPPLFCLPAGTTLDMMPFKRVARGAGK